MDSKITSMFLPGFDYEMRSDIMREQFYVVINGERCLSSLRTSGAWARVEMMTKIIIKCVRLHIYLATLIKLIY